MGKVSPPCLSSNAALPFLKILFGGCDDGGDEIAGERLSVRAFGFALVVTLELAASAQSSSLAIRSLS